MLSVHQIERQFRARHFESLLRGVAPIGIDWPLPLQIRLGSQPVAAMALALKRVIELTYGPTALSRELTQAIIDQQNADGSFGDSGIRGPLGDPLATAAVIAALSALAHEHASAPHPEAAVALERALAALANFQADDGLFHCPADRTDDDRALGSIFILTLLAGDDDFRQAVRLADLMNWCDEHAGNLDREAAKLWRMACIDAPASLRPARLRLVA